MDNQLVILEKDGAIATVTLHRPEVMNALNQELVEALKEALEAVKVDASVKAVILTGAGKGFCAGGDLGYLTSLEDPNAAKAFILSVGELVTLIMEMDKPVLAMVNGVAAGAGFNLALACDLVFCSSTARFAQSFVKVGLVPDCGGLYLLPRIVGTHKAKELMFTADLIDAPTALQMGIVNKVFEAAVLKEKTEEFAEGLAQAAPISLGLIKKMVNKSQSLDLGTCLEMEANLQALCMQTEDYREGVAAFKEKRTAVFKGK